MRDYIPAITVTHLQMSEFRILYYKGTWPNQRFGQAFCNYFNLTWPEVFYLENNNDAEAIIYNALVK